MARTMKIGLVGCGRIAPAHARAARDSSLCEIVACAARHEDRAARFAREWGIPRSYDSMEKLLEGESELDLVLLATWPADHLEQIRTCCRYDIRGIVCEKALAMNAEEGEEIRRIVEDRAVFLMEGLMYRHHPQIQKTREVIAAGEIGEVGYIAGYFCDRLVGTPDPDNWRFKPELGGGTMTAKGCYMVDAVGFLAGRRPSQAISCVTMHPDGYDIGHTATVLFGRDLTAHFEANHRTIWREEIRVYGTTGSIVVPHAILTATEERSITLMRGGRFEREPVDVQTIDLGVHNSYRLQLENAHACLFEGGTPRVPLEDSMANLRLTSALLKSTRTNRLEPVEG